MDFLMPSKNQSLRNKLTSRRNLLLEQIQTAATYFYWGSKSSMATIPSFVVSLVMIKMRYLMGIIYTSSIGQEDLGQSRCRQLMSFLMRLSNVIRSNFQETLNFHFFQQTFSSRMPIDVGKSNYSHEK